MKVDFTDPEITVLYLALEEFYEKYEGKAPAALAKSAIEKMYKAGYQVY